MKNSLVGRILNQGILAILTLALIATVAMGQNLVVSGSGSFSGAGTINVRGNITNTAPTTITGIVTLNGTSAQVIGTAGALTFSTLNVNTTGGSAALAVPSSVSDALSISAASTLDIQNNTLAIGGTSTRNVTGTLATGATSTVNFTSPTNPQTILGGFTYNGDVNLSGGGTKNLGGVTSIAGAFTHLGGDLTINNNLTISGATSSFATIADVTGTSTLALSGIGAKTIGQISGIASGSTISNTGASGLLTVTTLAGNAGSLDGGAAGITFANAATNGGNITGGAGPVTFSSTLAQSAGLITAGSGGVVFNGIPTISAGSITAGTGASLDFNTNIANSGTISLTGTGAATINSDFTSVGTLAFASGSQVTFDGAGQTIPVATYGNLTVAGSAAKTAAGAVTLAGNLVLNHNIDMLANTLTFSNAGTVTGTSEVVGAVQRTHTFAATTPYAFNRPEVTMQFTAINNAPVTITMRPGVAPTGVGLNYINRYYGVTSTADLSLNNATLQLYYVDAEIVGSSTETKYGFNKYTTSLSKLSTNAGSYTRTVGGASNTIALTNVNQGLVGVSEFAITPIGFYTIASGNWNANTTWGSTIDDVPTSTDDATIVATHAVTVPVLSTIANLTIEATGSLAVDGANFNATTINNSGAVTVAATRTLELTGTLTNLTAGSSVGISGIGTLAAVTNNGGFTLQTGGVANLSGAFTNNLSLSTIGTGALTITGFDLTNVGTLTNAGSVTVTTGNVANSGSISNAGTITVQ